MKFKFGLLPRVVLAIALGVACGFFLPGWATRIALTFNAIFGQFLGFAIPLLILGLVAPGIADLGRNAGRLLALTAALAYAFTLFSGFGTYLTGRLLFSALLEGSAAVLPEEGAALAPYFTVEMPPVMGVMSALVLAFVLGLGMAYIRSVTLKAAMDDFKRIIELVILRVIIPLLPFYIFGIFLSMTQSGQVAGVLGVLVIVFLLHDTPESKGLPPIEVLTGEESPEQSHDHGSTAQLQRSVIRNPFVWVLALSSAFMYVSRYAINGWGVLFLQEVKGYTLATATQVISVNALLGIVGTIFSGWLSDTLFHGRRNVLAFGFGVLNTVALCLFLYSGDGMFVNLLSMVLFGMAIGVLICFLGGLMAIDIVPREATGAALGIVGMASYVGAGLQDIVSGWLINSGKTVTDGVTTYDFDTAIIFWIAASALSFILALFVSKRSHA